MSIFKLKTQFNDSIMFRLVYIGWGLGRPGTYTEKEIVVLKIQKITHQFNLLHFGGRKMSILEKPYNAIKLNCVVKCWFLCVNPVYALDPSAELYCSELI